MNNYSKILVVFFIILSSNIYSQRIPNNVHLDKNQLQKISADPAPSGNAVEYIEFMGNDVWIATSSGLSKSTDNGSSWTNYNFDDDGISALSITNDTVWVGTWFSRESEISSEDEPLGSGLHYSADKGETWISITQPQDEKGDSLLLYGENEIRNLVWANPVYNFTRDIEFQNGTIWIANYFAGLYSSKDLGATWEKVILPPDTLDTIHPDSTLSFTLSSNNSLNFTANLNHVIFSIEVLDDSTLLVGTAGGINMSTDNGKSWKKFNHQNQTLPISGNQIIDLQYDESRQTIWASTWRVNENEFYGISSSNDKGETWETHLPGENVNSLAFTYTTNGSANDILAASNNGVFRSPDNGLSWNLAPQMVDDESNISLTSSSFRAVNNLLDENDFNNLWFGSEGGSATLKETGNKWEGEWKVFISSPEITSNSSSIAFPNPFAPDNEQIKIKYNFTGDSKNVTIRIFDFGMNLVNTVIQNVSRIGGREYIDNWNGRDENNEFVPNGVYFYRIDIGNDEPLYGKIMVVM